MAFLELALSTGDARDALAKALLSALPSEDLLAELATTYLGRAARMGMAPYRIAQHLVTDYVADTSVRILLHAARAMRPSNADLITFEATYSRRCFDQASGTASDVTRLDRLNDLLDPLGNDATARVMEAFEGATTEAAPRWATHPPAVSRRAVRGALINLIAEHDAATPPLLLHFATRLRASVTSRPVQDGLTEWIRTFANRLGIDASQVHVATPVASSSPRYLMVRLRPAQMGDRYLAKAWLLSETTRQEVWQGECAGLEEVCEALRGELGQRSALEKGLRGVPNDKLTFEFVLPRKLFDSGVDRWAIGVAHLAIGELHRVVVRSYERIYEMPDRGWRAKWNVWRTGSQRCVHLYDPAQHQVDKAFLMQLASRDVVALASVAPFSAGADDPLTEGIKIGVPVAVWPRLASSGARAESEHLVAFVKDPAADVRDVLLELRKQANGDSDARRHMTLLWDDPDRLPPDVDDFEDIPIGE
jgi:hypothetical protein